jgi:hypothetical protein
VSLSTNLIWIPLPFSIVFSNTFFRLNNVLVIELVGSMSEGPFPVELIVMPESVSDFK